tara:strand:+ start:348 stop:836 length:489 start_codon:yes stop_codon:yes gene_type:complete
MLNGILNLDLSIGFVKRILTTAILTMINISKVLILVYDVTFSKFPQNKTNTEQSVTIKIDLYGVFVSLSTSVKLKGNLVGESSMIECSKREAPTLPINKVFNIEMVAIKNIILPPVEPKICLATSAIGAFDDDNAFQPILDIATSVTKEYNTMVNNIPDIIP